MITITANIPGRSEVSKMTGKKFTYPARVETFTQDDEGRWKNADGIALFEAEVIDICKRASNWSQIKAAHFPMVGFHA